MTMIMSTSGKGIPHGIYDLQANKGYVSIGASSETAGFATDNLLWWEEHGIHLYPDAKNILLLCDAEPTLTDIIYSSTNFWSLPNRRGYRLLYVTILHIAQNGTLLNTDYLAKYTKQWRVLFFFDYGTVQKLIEQTSTKTGLTVVGRLNLKEYEKGIKVDKAELDSKRIAHHPTIPELNYRIYS